MKKLALCALLLSLSVATIGCQKKAPPAATTTPSADTKMEGETTPPADAPAEIPAAEPAVTPPADPAPAPEKPAEPAPEKPAEGETK